jgi:tRNA-dihydrouridine synthase B
LIKSIQLGNSLFPINLIQGPLAGVSCAPFRLLTSEYSQPAFTCTEMISCKTLIHQPKQRYIAKDPAEGPVCFQLSGSDARELGEAVKMATDAGADLVDLNCGCPVKKIRSRGAGSSLLTQADKLYQLIFAMKQNTHVPVSIKIRVEKSDEKFNHELVKVVSDAGADFLVVHGRHWTEHYETPCRHEEIQFFVEALKIPVIGNGDVADLSSLQKMFATGCAGVMIGRAGVGQPWLIAKLAAEMRGQSFNMPSQAEMGAMFLRHASELMTLLGNEKFAILQARKLAKYYARPLLKRMEFAAAVHACETLSGLKILCGKYFEQPF